MAGDVDGAIEQRHVFDDPAHLYAAGGAYDQLGLGVVDAHRQLVGGEAPEDDGVNGAEPGRGQHGDNRFRHHGHVDDHAITAPDPQPLEDAGEAGHLVPELQVGVGLHRTAGDRAVVDERRLLAAAVVHVTVQRVVAGVAFGAREPAGEGLVRIVQHPVPAFVPVDPFGRFPPESVGVLKGPTIDLVIRVGHDLPLFAPKAAFYRFACPRCCSASPRQGLVELANVADGDGGLELPRVEDGFRRALDPGPAHAR